MGWLDGGREEGLTGIISLKKHPTEVKTSCVFGGVIGREWEKQQNEEKFIVKV